MSDEQPTWYLIDSGGTQCGPYTEQQLRTFAQDGAISAGTQLWREGLPEWIPASGVEGLLPTPPSRPQLVTGAAVLPARAGAPVGGLQAPRMTPTTVSRSSGSKGALIAIIIGLVLLVSLITLLVVKSGSNPAEAGSGGGSPVVAVDAPTGTAEPGGAGEPRKPVEASQDPAEQEAELAKLLKVVVEARSRMDESRDRDEHRRLAAELQQTGPRFSSLLNQLTDGDEDQQNALLLRIASEMKPDQKAMVEDMVHSFMTRQALHRIRMIEADLQNYAENNGGKFPDSLDTLKEEAGRAGDDGVYPVSIEEADGSRVCFWKPRGKRWVDPWGYAFLYLGSGVSNTAPGNTPLIVQNPRDHEKVAVLLVCGAIREMRVDGGGGVAGLPEDQFGAVLAEGRNAGQVPLVAASPDKFKTRTIEEGGLLGHLAELAEQGGVFQGDGSDLQGILFSRARPHDAREVPLLQLRIDAEGNIHSNKASEEEAGGSVELVEKGTEVIKELRGNPRWVPDALGECFDAYRSACMLAPSGDEVPIVRWEVARGAPEEALRAVLNCAWAYGPLSSSGTHRIRIEFEISGKGTPR